VKLELGMVGTVMSPIEDIFEIGWMMRFFDSSGVVRVTRRRLPHWGQAGTICFITWRTADSIPKAVYDFWCEERDEWLRQHGIEPDGGEDWRCALRVLSVERQRVFNERFVMRWHDELDAGRGDCVLRRPELARIVADCFASFDGEQYELGDFVVMPNHVHLLGTFASKEGMLRQCESWKRFSAREINRATGRKGRFWQQDAFDHLVRNERQYEWLRRYIVENGVRAGLGEEEYFLGKGCLGE
jgi:putative transposase